VFETNGVVPTAMRLPFVSVIGCFFAAVLGEGFIYDEAAAARDIWLNQAIGCPVSTLGNWSCGLACETVDVKDVHLVADNNSNLIFVGSYEDDCLVVVRGTKNIKNGITDANFWPRKPWSDCPGCAVHSGFYNSWSFLRDGTLQRLTEQCSGKSVQVTGHSLGGAIAAIMVFELVQSWNISRLYTYGQPRTGNSEWSAEFNRRVAHVPHFRVVDYMDPVPHLAPDNFLFLGFDHTSPEVWYNATKMHNYVICEDQYDRRCSYQFDTVVTWFHGCDHCSYLGLSPCDCGSPKGECEDGATADAALV